MNIVVTTKTTVIPEVLNLTEFNKMCLSPLYLNCTYSRENLKRLVSNIQAYSAITNFTSAFDSFFNSFDKNFDNFLTYQELSNSWELSWTYAKRVIDNDIVDYFNSTFSIEPPNQNNFSIYAIKNSPIKKNLYLDLEGLKNTILSVGVPVAYLVSNEIVTQEIFQIFDTSLNNQIDYDEYLMNWKLAFTYSSNLLTICKNQKSYLDQCLFDCECKRMFSCVNNLCK
jgi:hypothetical protein